MNKNILMDRTQIYEYIIPVTLAGFYVWKTDSCKVARFYLQNSCIVIHKVPDHDYGMPLKYTFHQDRT